MFILLFEVMWIARDKNDALYVYIGEKPHKQKDCWATNGAYSMIDRKLFKSVKWSDKEPTEVEIVIKNGKDNRNA